jgi:hypothetical protein
MAGLLSGFMPGESGGMPDSAGFSWGGLLGIPSANTNSSKDGSWFDDPQHMAGLAMLAANHSNPENAVQIGMQVMQHGKELALRKQQEEMHNKLYQMQIDKYKADLDKENKLSAYMKTYGTPNSTTQSTTNVPAPQGTDAPNFATVPETTTTQTFDKQKYMNGAMQFLDAKDQLAMMTKQDKHTWQDAGDSLVQLDEQGQPTGAVMPKGASADAKLSAQLGWNKWNTQSADSKYDNETSTKNNIRTVNAEKEREAEKNKNPFLSPQVDQPKVDLPKSKLFKLDGGGSVSGTLDPVSGRYYTVKNGVKKLIQE